MTSAPGASPPLLTSDVDGGTFRLRRATLGDLPVVVPSRDLTAGCVALTD